MLIRLNAEPQIEGHLALTAYLDRLARNALGHYGERVLRLEAHLSDDNSAAKSDSDDIHCTLEAQIAGLQPIIAKDGAATPREAIRATVAKLERAIAHAIGKHDARRLRVGDAVS